MSKLPEKYTITSDFSDLEDKDFEGSKVAVGFRPSGELHLGNLLSIVYAVVIAEELGLELDLFCCDTDWSALVHEQNRPDNNDIMKLFYNRECECGQHMDLPAHRIDEIQAFLDGLKHKTGRDFQVKRLTDLRGDPDYVKALEKVLENIEEFDSFFGGGFRRRYRSPVVTYCDSCGFSHAKGCDYSRETGELVASCRNSDCREGFMQGRLDEKIGVYYLVDPVRDPSRDVAVHVFGGDYRDARKGQKTSKIEKVAKITELGTGETPSYFLGPMISDKNGKPLSKSKDTGKTISEMDEPELLAEKLLEKVSEWIRDEKKYVSQNDLID